MDKKRLQEYIKECRRLIDKYLNQFKLNPKQREAAIYLIQTGLRMNEIAKDEGVSHKSLRDRACQVYQRTETEHRAGLQADYIKFLGG